MGRVTGFFPQTISWILSRSEKVVLPEPEGPAMVTTLMPGLETMSSAMRLRRCEWKASEMRISSWTFPSVTRWCRLLR